MSNLSDESFDNSSFVSAVEGTEDDSRDEGFVNEEEIGKEFVDFLKA